MNLTTVQRTDAFSATPECPTKWAQNQLPSVKSPGYATIYALTSDSLFDEIDALAGSALQDRAITLKRKDMEELLLSQSESDSPSCVLLELPTDGPLATLVSPRLSVNRAVIAIARSPNTQLIVQSLKQGAIDFLPLPFTPAALTSSTGTAFRHDEKLRAKRERSAVLKRRFWSLTPREREVMPLLTHGLLNKQAASVLGISLVTLQIHRGQIMRKMQATSFAELVRSSMILEKTLHLPKPAECS